MRLDEAFGYLEGIGLRLDQLLQETRIEFVNLLNVAEQNVELVDFEAALLLPVLQIPATEKTKNAKKSVNISLMATARRLPSNYLAEIFDVAFF
jgi:hypothetical protein